MKITMNCNLRTEKYGVLYSNKSYEVSQEDGVEMSKKKLDRQTAPGRFLGRYICVIENHSDDTIELNKVLFDSELKRIKNKKIDIKKKQKLSATFDTEEVQQVKSHKFEKELYELDCKKEEIKEIKNKKKPGRPSNVNK